MCPNKKDFNCKCFQKKCEEQKNEVYLTYEHYEKECRKYQKEYIENCNIRDKTYLSFFTVTVAILGIFLNLSSLSDFYKKILIIVILFLVNMALLALISVCLSAKIDNQYLDNYYKAYNKYGDEILENDEEEKVKALINENKYIKRLSFIDETLFYLTILILGIAFISFLFFLLKNIIFEFLFLLSLFILGSYFFDYKHIILNIIDKIKKINYRKF